MNFTILLLSSLVTVFSNSDYYHRIDEARLHCDAVEQPNIEEYDRRITDRTWIVLADPPWTYCPYLEKEQPDILLKEFGNI